MKAQSMFRINPHLDENAVALFVDALKSDKVEQLPPRIRQHVAGCQKCREKITGLFSLIAREDYTQLGPHPFFDRTDNGASSESLAVVLRIAAVLVIAAGLFFVSYYWWMPRANREPQQASWRGQVTPDTTNRSQNQTNRSREESTDLRTADFAALPELDEMVNSTVRSVDIDVRSPKNGEAVSRKIVFSWRGVRIRNLTLTILDNKAITVWSSAVQRLPLVYTNTLKQGLYYWKIQSEDEILYVGKFFVRE